MAMWKRAMDYLGLSPEDVYEDYDPSVEVERPSARGQRGSEPQGRYSSEYQDDPSRPAIRPSRESDTGVARRFPSEDSGAALRPVGSRTGGSVRPITQPGEPVTVKPRRFDQAQEVADRFREGQAVIMNLEGVEPEVLRRLIDFASGVCYGLGGSMERVASGVYLLKPAAARSSYDGYPR